MCAVHQSVFSILLKLRTLIGRSPRVFPALVKKKKWVLTQRLTQVQVTYF